MKNEIEEDKIIELLNEYKSIAFGCDMSEVDKNEKVYVEVNKIEDLIKIASELDKELIIDKEGTIINS